MLCSSSLLAQTDSLVPQKPPRAETDLQQDSLRPQKKPKAAASNGISIADYKIISHSRDTVALDTTISIEKEYRYNFLRKDDFELLPFANVGQPYNRLGATLERNTLYPQLGATARHFNYEEVEDIRYYNVPTPMTDLFFKTTFEQGQLLDALLTFNTSRRFNVSVSFKGFRSLGKYQSEQAESGNFRTTANYQTPNKRYRLRAHIAAQDSENEQNGGLANLETQFLSGDPDFSDRSQLDVVLSDADNKVLGKRYFLEQEYQLLQRAQDSGASKATAVAIGLESYYETKFYEFTQTAENAFFGEAFLGEISDQARLKTGFNQLTATVSNTTLGTLKGQLGLYNYNYFFNSILVTNEGQIQNQLKGEEITAGASYENQIGGFKLKGNVQYTLSGELSGNLLNAAAQYTLNDQFSLEAKVHASSRLPNFNTLLYQSDYENYNWQNTASFEKEQVRSLQVQLHTASWGTLSAKYTSLDNHTYFGLDETRATQEQLDAGLENAYVRPFQENNTINYLKLRYENEFTFGHFALRNTLLYQQVTQDNQVLNLPDFVTRNTLYYSKHVFKKAMYVQTGFTFKYFTAYNIDAYNPLLGEFYVQEEQELGAFPLLDFFINAKIRQTRVYLKAEHLNSLFTPEPNYFSAPNYPYRDFVIRFGLVWNFFS